MGVIPCGCDETRPAGSHRRLQEELLEEVALDYDDDGE